MNYVSPLEPYLNWEGPVDRMWLASSGQRYRDMPSSTRGSQPFDELYQQRIPERFPGTPLQYQWELSPSGRGVPFEPPWTYTKLAGDVLNFPPSGRETVGRPDVTPAFSLSQQSVSPSNVTIAPLPMFESYMRRLPLRHYER
jgi:hypothetical protein